MTRHDTTALSKWLAFVLRHKPEAIGLTLDAQGWAEVDHLLRQCSLHGGSLDRTQLDKIVSTSTKQRFAYSADGTRIRANQGHSIPVELGHRSARPPELLFHGTVARALVSIREQGLRAMQRHHVHLTADKTTALDTAARRGKPLLLCIDAQAMQAAGHTFFLAPNAVWLVDAVPPHFLRYDADPKTQ